MHEFRYENMRRFVSWLAAKGSLRGGMTAGDAAAIVWTLAGPEVHGLLRRDRGWSQERYVAWLADTQRPDGTWDEPWFTGTGFPGDFYINYHLYRLVFPVTALGRYLAARG